MGVYSFIGDRIDLTVAEGVRNLAMQRFERRSVDVAAARFDIIALRTLRELAQRQLPQARLHFYRAPGTHTDAQQQQLVADARGGGLPARVVQTIEPQRLSHALLVTRDAAAKQARTGGPASSTVGRGHVSGLGWYVDPAYTVQNVDTQVLIGGLLIAQVVLRLTRLDVATARVVNSPLLMRQWIEPPRRATASSDPWTQIDDANKVNLLREALTGLLASEGAARWRTG